MKLPRYSLRTLFVLVTLTGVAAGWVVYQLNWIRQRHEFVENYQCRHIFYDILGQDPECPWSLRLFGETARPNLTVRKDRIAEAKRLFPEAYVDEDGFDDAR